MKKEKRIQINQHPARLLNIREVADLLGVSEKTVRRYLQKGAFIKPIRLNGRHSLRWKELEIIDWVNQQRLNC